jgi:hypothetical protein
MRSPDDVTAALALVDSRFQLLSLLEAINSGVVERPPDVLLRARTGTYERLLELGRGQLADVLPQPRSKTEYVRLLATRPELVIGDPFGGLFQTALWARVRSLHRVVLVEDGASAIRSQMLLSSGRPLTRAHGGNRARTGLATLATWRLGRLAHHGRVALSAGLPMPQEVAAQMQRRGIEVIAHEFEWTRSVPVDLGPPIAAVADEAHVVLGSSLTTDKLLHWIYYRDWLRSVVRPGSLFVPHRREPEMSQSIVQRAGARYLADFALPVELTLRDIATMLHVDCLPSTAAMTLRLVRGERGTTVHCQVPPASAWAKDEPEMRLLLAAIDASADSDGQTSEPV